EGTGGCGAIARKRDGNLLQKTGRNVCAILEGNTGVATALRHGYLLCRAHCAGYGNKRFVWWHGYDLSMAMGARVHCDQYRPERDSCRRINAGKRCRGRSEER